MVSKTRLPAQPRSTVPAPTARTTWASASGAQSPHWLMTLIWRVPPDSTPARWTNSATGGMLSRSPAVLAIRSTTGPPPAPPALSPGGAAQPDATADTKISASSALVFLSMTSPGRQRDAEPEDGPVRGEREPLAVRAENRRGEQPVLRAGPFRDQPVRPVVNQRRRWGLGAASGYVGVASSIDCYLAHVPFEEERCIGR